MWQCILPAQLSLTITLTTTGVITRKTQFLLVMDLSKTTLLPTIIFNSNPVLSLVASKQTENKQNKIQVLIRFF